MKKEKITLSVSLLQKIIDESQGTRNEKNELTKLREIIARNLRELRRSKGWRAQKAASKLGIKLDKLLLMEQGYRIKSINTLHKLAKGYGVSIFDLLQ